MKTIQSKLILLALLLTVSFAVEAKPSKSNKKTVTFNVMMHCHSCQEKIEKNLAYEPGVTNLKTDLDENTVTVTYNENKTDVKTLAVALKKIGYDAYPVGENCATKKGGCLNNPSTEINTMK